MANIRDSTIGLADRALSIRQPWAELIILGRKRCELRSRRTSHRGPILIHAAQRIDKLSVVMAGLNVETLQTGAIIGQADIVACEPFTPEVAEELRRARCYFGEWKPGLYAWKLERPLRLPEPIPYRGKLGMFRV
jgi:activating signal cointegrator 1